MKKHRMRLIDYFLHIFHIGEQCNCVIHWPEDVWQIEGIKSLFWPWRGTGLGCRQRSFKNGHAKTMNIYGNTVFLCRHCNENHRKKNNEYIIGHGKFLKEALEE